MSVCVTANPHLEPYNVHELYYLKDTPGEVPKEFGYLPNATDPQDMTEADPKEYPHSYNTDMPKSHDQKDCENEGLDTGMTGLDANKHWNPEMTGLDNRDHLLQPG